MPPELNSAFVGYNMPKYSFGKEIGKTQIDTTGSGPMGIWTKEDQATFELQMAQAEQMNAWTQLEYENWYNSYEQQVRRQRQAGLNPDLQGIDNMASASPAGVTVPSGPSGNGVGEVASMVGSIFSIFSTAMNIANGIQSFRSGREMVRGQKLDNASKLFQSAFDYAFSRIEPDTFHNDESTEAYWTLITDNASDYARQLGYKKSDVQAFVDNVKVIKESPALLERFYSSKSSTAQHRTSLAEIEASPYYFDTDESMRVALDPLIKLKFEAMKAAWKEQKSYGEFRSDYFSHQSGVIQGQAQNDIALLEAQKARMERMMLSARYNMLKSLYQNYNAGNQFSGIMLGLMDFGVNALPTVANMIK